MATPTSGSGRKKEAKSDFIQCQRCSTVLLPKDREKHEMTTGGGGCQSESGDDLGFGNTDYDFISRGRLFGTVRELQTKDELLGELSMRLQRQLLLASPFTLKMAGIAVNDHVVVSNASGHSSLRIAWPHMGAPLMAVSPLHQTSEFPLASRLRVQRFEGKLLDASLVELEQVTDLDIADDRLPLIFDKLRRTYDSTAVHCGEVVRCDHYCELYSFKVAFAESKASNIEEAMAALDIGATEGDHDHNTTHKYFRITHNTEFTLRRKQVRLQSSNSSVQSPGRHLTFEDIGGLHRAKASLRGLASVPPQALKQLTAIGVRPLRRILIIGPSGTGKSMLVNALAYQLNMEIVSISGQDLSNSDESSAGMAALLKRTRHRFVLLDNIDSLMGGGKRENGFARINAYITSLPHNAFVVATSSRVALLDEALRGLFDSEIETNVPKAEDRFEILKLLLRKFPHNLADSDINEVSGYLHGYTGANLDCLVRHAVVARFSKAGESGTTFVELEDLRAASRVVTATPMREVVLDIPKVFWSDIGGMDEVKNRLRKSVEWPLLHKDDFRRMGIKPPSGLLMYGPPGCAKTMIARALATESGLNFLVVKGPELFSKWVGDSERAIRDLFKKARAASPAIVFFDEIDAIATERKSSSGGGSGVGDRVLTQLLTEMDGVEALDDVMVVAATNRPDIIDEVTGELQYFLQKVAQAQTLRCTMPFGRA